MMSNMLIKTLLVTVVLLTGCVSYTFTKPEGFAQYEQEGSEYRAISADGVKIRVRQIENSPYGNAEMWMKSVKLYLDSKGYKETDSRDIETTDGKKGNYLEYIYRYYGDNYIYSVCFFVDRKNIYLIEAAGIEKYFKKRKEDVLDAVKNIKTGV